MKPVLRMMNLSRGTRRVETRDGGGRRRTACGKRWGGYVGVGRERGLGVGAGVNENEWLF